MSRFRKQPLDSARICLLGSEASGKSSLGLAFMGHALSENNAAQNPNAIEDAHTREFLVDSKLCKVTALDVSGAGEFSSLVKANIPGCDAYVVIYDATQPNALGAVPGFMRLIRDEIMRESNIVNPTNSVRLANSSSNSNSSSSAFNSAGLENGSVPSLSKRQFSKQSIFSTSFSPSSSPVLSPSPILTSSSSSASTSFSSLTSPPPPSAASTGPTSPLEISASAAGLPSSNSIPSKTTPSLKDSQESGVDFFLEIKNKDAIGGGPIVVLLSNKADLFPKVDSIEGMRMAASFGCMFMESSSQHRHEAEAVFRYIVRKVRHRRERIEQHNNPSFSMSSSFSTTTTTSQSTSNSLSSSSLTSLAAAAAAASATLSAASQSQTAMKWPLASSLSSPSLVSIALNGASSSSSSMPPPMPPIPTSTRVTKKIAYSARTMSKSISADNFNGSGAEYEASETSSAPSTGASHNRSTTATATTLSSISTNSNNMSSFITSNSNKSNPANMNPTSNMSSNGTPFNNSSNPGVSNLKSAGRISNGDRSSEEEDEDFERKLAQRRSTFFNKRSASFSSTLPGISSGRLNVIDEIAPPLPDHQVSRLAGYDGANGYNNNGNNQHVPALDDREIPSTAAGYLSLALRRPSLKKDRAPIPDFDSSTSSSVAPSKSSLSMSGNETMPPSLSLKSLSLSNVSSSGGKSPVVTPGGSAVSAEYSSHNPFVASLSELSNANSASLSTSPKSILAVKHRKAKTNVPANGHHHHSDSPLPSHVRAQPYPQSRQEQKVALGSLPDLPAVDAGFTVKANTVRHHHHHHHRTAVLSPSLSSSSESSPSLSHASLTTHATSAAALAAAAYLSPPQSPIIHRSISQPAETIASNPDFDGSHRSGSGSSSGSNSSRHSISSGGSTGSRNAINENGILYHHHGGSSTKSGLNGSFPITDADLDRTWTIPPPPPPPMRSSSISSTSSGSGLSNSTSSSSSSPSLLSAPLQLSALRRLPSVLLNVGSSSSNNNSTDIPDIDERSITPIPRGVHVTSKVSRLLGEGADLDGAMIAGIHPSSKALRVLGVRDVPSHSQHQRIQSSEDSRPGSIDHSGRSRRRSSMESLDLTYF